MGVQGTTLKVLAERKRHDDSVVVSRYVQQFELDNQTADTHHIKATLVDGVLTVLVPKKDIKEIQQASCFEIKVENTDAPPVQDDKKDESIRLTFDLPGVKVTDTKVSIADGKLLLGAGGREGKE